jgi:metal transporter CNNM
VLFFGEVLPAAIFTGPKQLEIAASLACFAQFLMIIFTPVALPLALLLDYVVGEDHEETLNRDELACMIRLTRSENLKYLKLDDTSDPNHSEHLLLHDEVNIMTGILELGRKSIKDIMVPIEHVHMVSSDLHLDSTTLSVIDTMGRSRLPVYGGNDRNFIYGYVLVKKLITEAGESGRLLKDSSAIRIPLYVDTKQSLFDVLNMFQTGKAHIAIVSENAKRLEESLKANVSPDADSIPIGIISMEDIFEAMLKEQIFDEEDIGSNRKPSTSAMSSILMMLTNKGGRKSGISLDSRSKGYEPVPGYSTFSAERNRSFSGSTAVSVNDGNTVINIPQVLRNSSKS